MEPLFLKPYFQPKIWGGRKLEEIFDYDLPDGDIGECWAISGHRHGQSTVINGEFAGTKLGDLWNEHRELFGDAQGEVFPLLTKILDAEDSLSVQVHPDNAYAAEHEGKGELGKTECWYVIDADEGAELIFGHNAQTHKELNKMLEEGDWKDLLRHVPVKKGDFFYVPSGTVHALNKGILVLETQQSSDTTYRMYDYDRVDKKTGEKRELHIKQSEDTITVPHVDPKINIETEKFGANTINTFVHAPQSPFFAVYEWLVKDEMKLQHKDGKYTLASVITGSGKLTADGNEYDLKKGDHFLIPAQISDWTISGDLQLIASESEEK